MTNLVRFVLPVVLMLNLATSGYGQQTDLRKEQKMEELIESLVSSEDATAESSLLLDDLSYYADHPIYINKATEDELLRLNVFNFKQVRTIMDYREKYGRIITLNELSVIGGFSDELLQKIDPFVRFDQERDSLQKRRDNLVHQSLLARIKGSFPTAAGYLPRKDKPPAYAGKPSSYFTRYRAEVGNWLEVGVTAENDAGEDFFRRSNKYGFDFLSGYLDWQGKGVIRKVVLGDYHLRFGQGVNLWSGGGVSYVSDLSSMMRTAEGIRPYSSSDENQFFRGAAIQFGFKPLKLSLFFSDKRKDANMEADTFGHNFITSFRLDGLHRTSSELADEKNVNERMMGAYADFRFYNWRFGILADWQKFGLPVSKGDAPYKSKTFEGDRNFNIGIDYQLIINQISLFGEAGLSPDLKPAVVNGMVWKAHPQLSLSLLYRKYDPSFHSFNSGAFAEGSGGRNEEGFFTAFEFSPVAKLKVGGQADLFYFPWMTYQTITPAQGRTLAFQVELSLRKDLMVYLHARFVTKPQKTAGTTGVPGQWDESTSKWRIHSDWKINDQLQIRYRFEYVGYRYHEKKENGFLVFQDLIYTASLNLKFWFRLTYYRTDGYNSRIYSYENDLLYYFAIPEFHGKGMRSYLNLKWQPCRLLTFYFKGGYTLREGAISMGSGNDASPGNHRFDLRGQVYLKF